MDGEAFGEEHGRRGVASELHLWLPRTLPCVAAPADTLRSPSLVVRSPGCTWQVDLVLKILCSEDPATGLPVLRARDLAALGLAVARLWRPHPAMRGGRSIVDEAACMLVQTCCSTLQPDPADPVRDQWEVREPVLIADTTTPPPATLADGDWLWALRRWESRFSDVHPDIKIGEGGRRVTLHTGEQQQWRTAMLGMHVMCRGRHYAEFTLIRSTRQGSMTVGVVDSRFRPEAETGSSATKTPSGWGYWAHSVSHASPLCCLPRCGCTYCFVQSVPLCPGQTPQPPVYAGCYEKQLCAP